MSTEAAKPGGDPPEAQETPSLPALELRDGLPRVIDDLTSFEWTCSDVAAGTGPVALDAERASGYRYSQRAYLVQLRREGTGSALIDPISVGDLQPLDDAIGDAEWILHAATQDLGCLRELNLTPRRLFDTELAGRLLNLPRVGLATLVERFLGYTLAKEHSAVDWSTRPLPEPWLEYAALDVEVLIELRDRLDEELVAAGKRQWAAEEFDWLLGFSGPRQRHEPWRRTSGLHKARGRRTLGIVRELWETRDALAAQLDVSPGKVLPDAAIIEIAMTAPTSRGAMRDLRSMRHRGARRHLDTWIQALRAAQERGEDELPTTAAEHEGPPPPRAWADKNPAAALRLKHTREAIAQVAERNEVPAENLLTPETVRRLAWQPPAEITVATVSDALESNDARPWQIALAAEDLTAALDA